MITEPLAFIDRKRQQDRLGDTILRAIARVLKHGSYIMGPEIRQLEDDLTRFCGASHAVTCANGTDALGLILMALKVGSSDGIFCPSFTFAATAEAVAWFGATPVFVDIRDETFNIDLESLEAAIQTAKLAGLWPAGVITVDLFGLPADYDAIEAVCSAHRLWLLSHAAQSFGGEYKGRQVGTIGIATATSFFPAKPLGCYGDGGAVFTDDDKLATTLKSLRVHGQGANKYDNVAIGINGRLDTMQAAILIEKLRIFPDEIGARNQVAIRYNQLLKNVVKVPEVPSRMTSVWAKYTVRVSGGRRDALVPKLKEKGIPTVIYYPKPLHRQAAYKDYPVAGNGLPVSERVALEVLSLPTYPYLKPHEQDYAVEILTAELGRQ